MKNFVNQYSEPIGLFNENVFHWFILTSSFYAYSRFLAFASGFALISPYFINKIDNVMVDYLPVTSSLFNMSCGNKHTTTIINENSKHNLACNNNSKVGSKASLACNSKDASKLSLTCNSKDVHISDVNVNNQATDDNPNTQQGY
eukprot:Pgem_evm1s1085